MGFDVEGARKAGYSEPEILDHLAKQSNFDLVGAKKAGYNDTEILQHLSTTASAPASRGTIGASDQPAYDPAGALRASMAAGPVRAPDTSALQNVKVAARAASPYATAAGVGALAGAPFGGFVGSAAGAGLATLGLAAGDVGTAGYNALANYMGWNRLAAPSETIQNAYQKIGVGAPPQTSGQAMLDAIVSGAAGAGSQARAFQTVARGAQSPVTRGVLTELGQQPAVQMGAGAGGAAAPTALQEYADVTNPYALVGSSLAASILGGKAVAETGNVARGARATAARMDTPSDAEQIINAQRSYARAADAGVVYRPEAVTQFVDDAARLMNREGFTATPVPGTPQANPNIATAMARLEAAAANGEPITLDALDRLRRDAGTARLSRNPDGSPNYNERRLGLRLSQAIDDFALRPPPDAVIGGDHPAGAAALTDARGQWSRMRKSSEISELVDRARVSAASAEHGKLDEAIRTQFARLANEITEGYHPGFTEAEIANIRKIAENRAGSTVLKALSNLKLKGTDLPSAAANIATGAIALPARAGRNALAELNAANLAAGIRRGDVTPPLTANMLSVGIPGVQQTLNTLANR
jgi:hypothetical protein